MASYISRQINHLTDSIGLKVPPGDYKVQVFFLIERNGSVTNARALNDPGFNFAKLAEQIIQCAPDWEPSTRNGKFTRTYKRENIIFKISSKTKCGSQTEEKLLL